ncbi:MAG: AsmA-like C-terminal region-containing protein [Vicinamibacterales bacterium]
MRQIRAWRGTLALVLIGLFVGLVVAAAIFVGYRVPLSSERLRREVISTLAKRLDADVELASLELQPLPRMRASGTGLVIRHRRQPDVPLISIGTFTVTADLGGLLRKHVANVTVEGLEIRIAPGDRPEAHEQADPQDPERGQRDRGGRARERSELVIDELVADAATVTVLPREPGRRPKVWELHRLRLESVGLDQQMPFTSRLTNAVPPGSIETSGTFGPWNVPDPGRTPVAGSFTFEDADLGVFTGISGTLASTGTYTGTLDRLTTEGQTVTPDFTLAVSGHSVPLETTYRAVVDGTNGDTILERIEASFLNSRLVASGSVVDREGAEGRFVSLDVDMPDARLEDVLWLAVKTPEPTMTGALALKTRLDLPPGRRDVVEKLALEGDFKIEEGRFTDPGVQRRINGLSGRARGRGDATPSRVTSTFQGRFRLADGRLRLAPLRFDVPGALVDVRGQYALRQETLSFTGHVVMDARISQTVTGWKGWLLKPIDPLFRRNGRTFVPITIRGTRDKPRFGLDFKRVFRRGRADTRTAPAT